MNSFIEIKECVELSDSVIISTHIQPDGDGIGSMLALYIALSSIGKKVDMVLDDKTVIPTNLKFLPYIDEIIPAATAGSFSHKYDVAFVLDAGNFDRIGNVAEIIKERSKKIVNIDHHVTNDSFGDVNFISREASATGEIVFDLMEELSFPFTFEVSTCLFTAISTDTGFFSYSNTTSRTFDIASSLVAKGASPSDISRQIYDTKAYNTLAALSECIMNIKFECDGAAAFMYVTEEIMKKHNVSEPDIDDFISYVRSINGVEVAVTLRESSKSVIRVGFRSKTKVDVAKLALSLGGGGHIRAAGCTLNTSFDEAASIVTEAVKRAIREA